MRLLCLLLLTFFAAPAAASPICVAGRLAETGSGKAIDFAEIYLFTGGNVRPARQTLPDEQGGFRLDSVDPGAYTLMIRLIGYDVLTREVALEHSTGTVDLGVLYLTPLENGIAEVEVVAARKQLVYKLDKKVVDASSNIMGGGGSAVDILENTPSVRVDAEGNLSFRGSSGFTVYVDGKPSVFSGSQALEQIPAGHIENIEIITTPSARHDAEGDVGIINVITKKHTQRGLSGTVNLSGSTALSRNVDFLLTRQNEASRWYAGGVWFDKLRKSDFEQQKTTVVDDLTTTSRSKGPRVGDNYNYTLKAGWAYALLRTSFSVDVEGGYRGNKRNGRLDYRESRFSQGTGDGEIGDYRSLDDYDNRETIGLGTVAVGHRFNDKGHELSASFYYKYGGGAVEYFQSDLFNLQGEREQGHRAWESEYRITARGNLDYVLPYSKTGKIEAGYQYYSYLEDSKYKMQFWNPETKTFYWRDDIYNTSYFRENVNSVYAILSENLRALEIQAGVRGEYTHTRLRSSIAGASRDKRRFEGFPSMHLGYTFPRGHRLLVSYSRRTTRPQLFYMEPYITFRDYYTAEIGNPDIRPEYIHSYELTYRKSFRDNNVSATFFHRSRRDKIERLRVPYEAGVTLDSMANVGHDYSTGVELTAVVRVARWWNTSLNGNLYYYKIRNELAAGGGRESSTNYDIMWNNAFDAGKNTRIQLDANFVGPSVTTQGRTDAFWYVNLAVRQQFFKRKLSATLSCRDLFGSARYVSDIRTADLQSLTRIRPKYPLIALTLGYVFNSFKAKTDPAKESHDLFEGTNH